MIGERRDYRGDIDGGGNSGRGQPADRLQPLHRHGRPGLQQSGQIAVKGGDRQGDADQSVGGQSGQQIEIAQNQRGFGGDGDRMPKASNTSRMSRMIR